MRPTRLSPPARRALSATLVVPFIIASACGGGGDGGTAPPTVASVQITAGANANLFQTLTRTTQLTATARDAAGAAIPGVTFTWATSNAGTVSVSGTGLATAVANGSANITATGGGVSSSGFAITVAQVPATLGNAPAAIAFGALGSTRQLGGTVTDSSGATVAGAPAVTWARAGTGAVATVSPAGLVTSIGVGISDTAVGTSGTATIRVPISVTQLVASVFVTPAAPETLRTTGRTVAFAAQARDSNANVIAGAPIAWSSTATGVATVGAGTGLATAVADGTTQITATTSSVAGARPLVVRRHALTFTLTPPSATITTAGGTQVFNGVAQDSVSAPLPIAWLSRSPVIAGVTPGAGLSTTATAAGNGTTYIVMSAGTRSDSAQLVVSGQGGGGAPVTAAVDVGDTFFRSARNFTQNAAVDTVAIGGTVTWTWIGTLPHSAQSQGPPSFTSSTTQTAGTYSFLFPAAGTYQYDCAVHGPSMTGRIVVR